MPATIQSLLLPGGMIERGFWLYVWRIESPLGELLYVGRTGDSSSPNASDPFTRMGQHLGKNDRQNVVRKYLKRRGTSPEECASIRLIAYGPMFPEVNDWDEHRERKNKTAALEKALAETLKQRGYDLLNKVHSSHTIDAELWRKLCTALSSHFPELTQGGDGQGSP